VLYNVSLAYVIYRPTSLSLFLRDTPPISCLPNADCYYFSRLPNNKNKINTSACIHHIVSFTFTTVANSRADQNCKNINLLREWTNLPRPAKHVFIGRQHALGQTPSPNFGEQSVLARQPSRAADTLLRSSRGGEGDPPCVLASRRWGPIYIAGRVQCTEPWVDFFEVLQLLMWWRSQ
jgi:hypothetical protein